MVEMRNTASLLLQKKAKFTYCAIAAPEKKAVHRMCHSCSNELQIRAMHHIALSGYSDTATRSSM
jgi:hypothetical protein